MSKSNGESNGGDESYTGKSAPGLAPVSAMIGSDATRETVKLVVVAMIALQAVTVKLVPNANTYRSASFKTQDLDMPLGKSTAFVFHLKIDAD